jgi:amino acid transporter
VGQAGASVYGAYEVLVSMGIITYFIPYMYLFASLIRFQREPAEAEIWRIPGGKPVAVFVGVLGFITSVVTIVLSLVPPSEEPHKVLAVAKIAGLTGLLIVAGIAIFYWGSRRQRAAAIETGPTARA